MTISQRIDQVRDSLSGRITPGRVAATVEPAHDAHEAALTRSMLDHLTYVGGREQDRQSA